MLPCKDYFPFKKFRSDLAARNLYKYTLSSMEVCQNLFLPILMNRFRKIIFLAATSEGYLQLSKLDIHLEDINSLPHTRSSIWQEGCKMKQVMVAGACSRTSHIVNRHPRTQQDLGLPKSLMVFFLFFSFLKSSSLCSKS